MLKKISFFVCLGFLVTFFLAQFDPWVHQTVIRMCQNIAVHSLSSEATFTIESLNFFSPSIVLCNVEMKDMHGAWLWKCKRCEVHSSWVELLLKGVMDKHIVVHDFECSSLVENGVCAIEKHIIALTAHSLLPIPSDVKSLIFKNSRITFSSSDNGAQLSLFFNSSSLKISGKLKTMMSLYDGYICYDDCQYCHDIAIDISLLTWYENNDFMCSATGSGILCVEHMKEQGMCYIIGSLDAWRGRFSLRNAYNSFIIDPIIITDREIRIESSMPLQYIMRLFHKAPLLESIVGTVDSSIRVDKTEERIDGHLVIQDAVYGKTRMCDVAKIMFSRRDNVWKGKLNLTRHNQECYGVGYWDETAEYGYGELYNTTHLSMNMMPHWRIMPRNFWYHFLINKKEGVGIYHINATNILSNIEHSFYGGCSLQDSGVVRVSGLCGQTEFSAKAQLTPTIEIIEGSVLDKDKKSLVSVRHESEKNAVCADVSCAFVRQFMSTFFHYDIQGEGIFSLRSSLSYDAITMDINADDITIRLPETYNFVDGIQSRIKYSAQKKRITVKNTSISLHSGTLHCPRAVAFFNDHNDYVFSHAFVLFDRCFFNMKKDLFAIVSGNLRLSHKKANDFYIKGNIIIDRGQLKANIFSETIQKRLFAHIPITCHLAVETKMPLKIDTPFLQTKAKINLTIDNNISDPCVAGTIALQSGTLNFPYKPLLIHKGNLIFSPEQSYDPTVELIARNKVKNYDISLQVVGSLLNHHIVLDSIPPLSEEQIMTLLLVGSQESSLNRMIPALIVQNLKNLIFSHNQSTFLEKYFAPLLRPFHINLVPSFADQTGRGGLRGMLEVSINDRWRAMLQKNFSLTEDTRVELEFSLSDDITIRGIRDERRDLGGEIEMRWKF